ncbi:glycosyltransferase family 2 protein [Thiobacter aerophilum]|uniref:Glycosyltransferase family 2 protein n=1 Tax=Thiobacter aerophilum TaxID=3121275 RepID=A0ABV0EDF5_9BURK
MPAISVIMPCYNAARFLPMSVGSVLAQTFSDWELIAVDDGSTDDTAEVLATLPDPRIQIIRQRNRGLPASRNAGLEHATGQFVAFLDADDTWHPEFMEAMVRALETTDRSAIAYCGWQNVGLAEGRGQPFVPPDYETPDKPVNLLKGCRWPVHAAMLPTGLAKAVRGFDEQQKAAEDFDFWLRTAIDVPLVRVARVLAYYHHHGSGQMTRDRAKIARYQVRAQQKFLATHPEIRRQLGRQTVRHVLWGPVLRMGYESYWQRDLPAARRIFREVMKHGYGGLKDWLYMLPAWLPESWHAGLLRVREDTPREGTS